MPADEFKERTRFLTGVAQAIPDEEIARAVARQRLTSRLSDHPVAPLADCVQMGRAVGLSMSEMQRVTGAGRQTLYRHLPDGSSPLRRPPRPQADTEVLMLLAAEGTFASAAVLAKRAGLDPRTVQVAVTDLAYEELCELRRDALGGLEVSPTARTYGALRERFDDLLLRQPEAISVYVLIPPGQSRDFARAAQKLMAEFEYSVISPSVAPSLMAGPELAFTVNAATIRRAIEITRDLWRDLLELRGLPFSEPQITNIIPVGSIAIVRSDVLDSFVEGAIDAEVAQGDALRATRERFTGGISEAALAGRCLTAAARALRRAVGSQNDPGSIVDSESAFTELQPAYGVPVSSDIAPLKRAVVEALTLATDRLGPIPGGRLGSMRAPGEAPAIVEGVTPSTDELEHIGRLSGRAVALAHNLPTVDIDCVAEMAQIIIPADRGRSRT